MVRRVGIIGAGLGGLAAAIRLARAGCKVTVLEQNPEAGGKCARYSRDGYTFDTGPSVLTLPQVLDDLFAAAGENRADWLPIEPVQPGHRYFFADGSRFDAPGEIDGFEDALLSAFPGEAAGWRAYRRYMKRLWELSAPLFLYRAPGPRALMEVSPLTALRGLVALRPETMAATLRRHFRDPRVIQLFSRYATYNGSDPGRTPATFNVIPYAELAFGTWRCRGGMYALVDSLVRLAGHLGVDIRYGEPVDAVTFDDRGRRVTGVVLKDGRSRAFDDLVVNADGIGALTGPLFRHHPRQARWQATYAKREASGSGYVVLAAINRPVPDLAVHNVFFSGDYRKEFRQQFATGEPLDDPTIYLHAASRTDPDLAPAGHEAWFLLVNAPSLDRVAEWPGDYGRRLLDRLADGPWSWHLDARAVAWHETRSPRFFRDRFGGWHGALYGLSSNAWRSAFWRLPNRYRRIGGLFFAGGSAHPGGGIPLVLLSGKLAAEGVLAARR